MAHVSIIGNFSETYCNKYSSGELVEEKLFDRKPHPKGPTSEAYCQIADTSVIHSSIIHT